MKRAFSTRGATRRAGHGKPAGPRDASSLAVSGQEEVWLGGWPRRVKPLLAARPQDGWTRLRAGGGAKGPCGEDGRWLPLAAPDELAWRRWLVVRRRSRDPTELTADVVLARHDTALEAAVRGAGSRWTRESGGEAATGEVGLDADEGRGWTGW